MEDLNAEPKDDFPFEKEKFDAGIDVDEDSDPKKYIEKLTGKLAQKVRDYNEKESDIDLNKFVINSLIPATVTVMPKEDAKDVVKKVEDNINDGQQVQNNQSVDNQDSNNDNEIDLSGVEEDNIDEEYIDGIVKEIVKNKDRKFKKLNPFSGKKF